MRERHNVNVIELNKDVLYEAKFKKANPDYLTGKPCAYLGMTGHDPDTRVDQHLGFSKHQVRAPFMCQIFAQTSSSAKPSV